MITKTVKCPECGNEMSLTCYSGKKTQLKCPHCNTTGIFTFPNEESKPKTSNDAVIEVSSLTKRYDHVKAVDDVSFSVRSGEIFGFLGPNGAGKTTTIKAMLGLIHTNAGEIKINGLDIMKRGKEVKKVIGYLPEKVAFYNNLTAVQNLRFYAEMKNAPVEQCQRLIDEFKLSESGPKKVGAFSKGMIQRLGMARAVLGNPSILILDEPSGGLDPRGVVLIREKIREMRERGATIFVSSHILSEIQEVCGRVGIINKGVLVAQDSVSALSKKLNLKPTITVELEKISDTVIDEVKKINGIDKINIVGDRIDVICGSDVKVKVILAIANAGGNILNLYTKEPSLEEVFMRYTEG
jgi:ABC-type multidrug transport system ATPase subunit